MNNSLSDNQGRKSRHRARKVLWFTWKGRKYAGKAAIFTFCTISFFQFGMQAIELAITPKYHISVLAFCFHLNHKYLEKKNSKFLTSLVKIILDSTTT